MTGQFGLARTAEAQVAELPSWAVVEFTNKSEYGGTATAAASTDAISRELSKSGRYNILPKNQVDAQMKEDGMMPPLERLGYLKLGQSLNVDAIVSGTVERVIITKNPMRAKVIMSVYVYDAHSGRAISGAGGVEGLSTGRAGMTGGEDALVQEAIQLASLEAVSRINSLRISDATVLFADASRVYLNKGTRNGFKAGMDVLILRQGDYVATVKLNQVSGDDAEGAIKESTKGVQPGDKARAVFPVDNFAIKSDGKVVSGRPKSSNLSGVIATVLVVGLLIALLGKSGSGNTATNEVVAESLFDAANGASVKVSWSTNLFSKGAQSKVEWHIWRNDRFDQPVGVVPGGENFYIDDTNAGAGQFRDMLGLPGPPTCNTDPELADFTQVAVVPGTTYTYSVSLVYKISSIDLPGGGGDEVQDCYFESDRVNSKGNATCLNRPALEQPPNGSESVNLQNVKFSWDAVLGSNAYLVQISTDITFNSNVRNLAEINTAQTGGIVSTNILDIRGFFPGANRLYWRVGARNLSDSPGPASDAKGNRYVFSLPFQFTPVDTPPPPPGG